MDSRNTTLASLLVKLQELGPQLTRESVVPCRRLPPLRDWDCGEITGPRGTRCTSLLECPEAECCAELGEPLRHQQRGSNLRRDPRSTSNRRTSEAEIATLKHAMPVAQPLTEIPTYQTTWLPPLAHCQPRLRIESRKRRLDIVSVRQPGSIYTLNGMLESSA